jgi:hypothetical protein
MNEPQFDELLLRLVAADVRFVLVGGLAVGAWGVVRGTKDVGIVPDTDPENLERLAGLAVELGGRVQLADAIVGSAPSLRTLLSSGEPAMIETELGELDVVQGLEGVPSYEELDGGATVAEIVGVEVSVCSLADLRAMKKAAGRTRDTAELEDLDAANPDT